jgi:hypothetical protein
MSTRFVLGLMYRGHHARKASHRIRKIGYILKMTALCDITPCILVEIDRRFYETKRALSHKAITIILAAVRT